MKLPGAETQAPVTTLVEEVELLELDALLDTLDELDELDELLDLELLELVDDEDELMLELLERELALTELTLELDDGFELDTLDALDVPLDTLDAELTTEEELAALELTMLLMDEAVDKDEELFPEPTDELATAPCDPLQALSSAAISTQETARSNVVDTFMATLLPSHA